MTTTPNIDASDHDEFEPASPDKLYAHHCRQLSAMMDGELSPDQARFMLRRLEHDAALAGCWERWQVCGDVLRGRRHALLPADFAHRVALAIVDDSRVAVAVSSANSALNPRPRLARWGGGAALAASVAVVALLVARQLPGDASSAPEPASTIVAQQASATPPAPAPAPPIEAPRTTAGTPATGTGAVLATVAVAAAEVPRRASERRARGRRAADREQALDAVTTSPMVAAAEIPALVEVSTAGNTPPAAGTDPFAAPPSVDIAPARPWPRAILPAYPADSAFTAGYGNPDASPGFAPFEPRLDAGSVPAPPGADAGGADSGGADSNGADPGAEPRDGTSPH